MSPFATSVSVDLVRTTLLLAGTGLAAALLLRVARVQSPTLHRAAWCVTLLVGWTFLRLAVSVPWYAAEVPESQAIVMVPPQAAVEIQPLDELAEPLPAFVPEASLPSLKTPVSTAEVIVPSAPTTAMSNAGPRVDWQRMLLFSWILGMAAIVAWWLFAYLRFVIFLPRSLPGEPEWQSEWDRMQAADGNAPRVALRMTANLGPLLCRLPRGAELLVPVELWQALSRAERAAILRHELAHHQRRDVWKSLAMRVLALPHWFNPIAWLAVRRFDEAAEWACDRAAMGTEPTAYARMLLRLGELANARLPLGSAMSNLPLTNRIRRLLTLETKEDSAMRKALLVSLLLLVIPLASVQVTLVAEQPAEKIEAPTAVHQQPLPSKDDSPATPAVPTTTVPTTTIGEPVAKPAVRAAELKMAETAKKAFEATYSAYLSGTTTLDPLVAWSTRWLAAELAIAKTRDEQVTAARANLERLQGIHKGISALYTSGSRGGEAEKMETINYYVADAERRLAEIEVKAPPAFSVIEPSVQPRSSTVDSEQARTSSERAKPRTAGQQNLRYDGKTFDQWKQQLQTDLSPVLRKDAMHAMREFASHGYGNEAAQVIFDLVQGFPEHSRSAAQHDLEAAASYAAMQVPPNDLLPFLKAALESTEVAQRRFAIELVPYAPQAESTAFLVDAMNDPDPQVAAYARALLASAHPANPQLNAWLDQALQGNDFKQLVLALPLVVDTSWKNSRGQSLALSRRDDLLVRAVALLDHNDEEVAKLVKARLSATRFDSALRKRTLAALEAYFESLAPASSAKAMEVWKRLSDS